jgi:plastocyanin
MNPRLVLSALALIAAAALATACGDSDTSDDPLTVGGPSETITIEDSSFKPGNLQVPAGATVTFVNEDSAVHDAKARDDSWETEHLGRGDSGAVTLDAPGDYDYYCTIHPNMKARVTVVED